MTSPTEPGVSDPSFTWISAGLTNTGCVREINEDACLEMPEKKIWAVADGMGGHTLGDIASQTIIEQLRHVRVSERFSSLVDSVEGQLMAAHDLIRRLGNGQKLTAGSTVAVLLVFQRHALVMWTGDSRIYLSRGGRMHRLTRDHSYVEELLERGEINREQAASHPQANVITRAVGVGPTLFLDMDVMEAADGDCFLICSDGLYREVTEDELHRVLLNYPPAEGVEQLINIALRRGARDNVTVIIVKARENAREQR